MLAVLLLSRGGVAPGGKPIGTDFLSFWSASRLLLDGQGAAAVYDPPVHAAAQARAFPGVEVGYAPFAYPPIFLLICWPLGLLPYLASLAAWLAATGYAYWRVVRTWLGERGLALAALAYPAVLVNAGHGQNGFLTAALFGGGARLLATRPFAAGLLLGALVFKPQLGLMIPVALIAARNWRAVAGAAAAVVVLTLASLLAFGPEAWAAFLRQGQLMRAAVLDQGLLDPAKMQTAFAALRLWGVAPGGAYTAQAVVTLAVAAALARLAWRGPRCEALGPALAAASLLATPYLLDYDLTLAAIPMAWLLAEARRTGFRRWEKAGLLAAFVLPLVSRGIAMRTGVPLGPPVLAGLFLLVLRRAASAP